MASNRKPQPLKPQREGLLRPREAARELRVAFPTIKQWIYRRKFGAFKPLVDITVFRKSRGTACYTGREQRQRLSEAV